MKHKSKKESKKKESMPSSKHESKGMKEHSKSKTGLHPTMGHKEK
jgi:hypothetical protein